MTASRFPFVPRAPPAGRGHPLFLSTESKMFSNTTIAVVDHDADHHTSAIMVTR